MFNFLVTDDGDPLKTEFHFVAPSFFLSTTLDIFHDILTLQTRTFKTKFTTNYLANFNSKLIWCGIVTKVNETLRA